MTKKVFIGVLAALMLFAFTACENNGVSQIAGVNVTGGEDTVYLPGETVDLNDYTFTLVMYDGSTKPASASNFDFDSLVVESSATPDEVNYINGTYEGAQNWTVQLPVQVGQVTKLEVNADEAATKTYYTSNDTDYQKINLEGVVITAKYEFDGVEDSREVAIDNKALDADFTNGTTSWTSSSAIAKAEVTVMYGGQNATYETKLEVNPVNKVELKATEGYQIYSDGTASGSNKLAYASVTDGKLDKGAKGVYLEATYENGEVLAVEGTSVKFSNDSGATYAVETASINTVTIPGTGNMTVYAQYVGTNVVAGLTRTASLANLPIVADSVVGIKVTESDTVENFKVGKSYTAEELAAFITVQQVKASDGDSATLTGAELDYGAEEDYTIDLTSFDATKSLAGDKVVIKVTTTEGGFTGDITLTLAAK